MKKLDLLTAVVEEHRTVRLVEEDIYSVLPNVHRTFKYDKKAAVYDLVVGTRLYNRLMWGGSPHNYGAFARRAIDSYHSGWLLDAGCGSLLFTIQAYVETRRPIIACDQSLEMLRRARARLAKSAGSVVGRIILVQADLADLPFRAGSFQTILSMNVLHHYADVANLVRTLKNLLTDNGDIYLTSLVMNSRFVGDRYLSLLHKKGWLVQPRKNGELRKLLQDSLKTNTSFWTEGNMAYATTAILSDQSEPERH